MKFLFAICILCVSCSDSHDKTQNVDKIRDTISNAPTPPANQNENVDIEFQGLPGFLPQNFDDTIRVKQIQRYVHDINTAKLKDSIELENEEFMENMTDGGGSLRGYFQNGKLVKIKEWYGLSWGVLQVAFYFDKNELVFADETEDLFFVDSNGIDPSRFDGRFHGNYYFTNGKLFDETSLGHSRFERDDANAEKEYLRRAIDNRTILLKKRFGTSGKEN